MKTKAEITSIWESMKEPEERRASGKQFELLNSLQNKRSNAKKITKPRKNAYEVRDVHKFQGDHKLTSSPYHRLAAKDETKSLSLSWTKQTIDSLGDSDDEWDDGVQQLASNELNDKFHNINRFPSALQSQDNQNTAMKALDALYAKVQSLCRELPVVTEMDFPPPFDSSKIALTNKYGESVSDMATANYAPHWSQWQRTMASFTEQFVDNSEIGSSANSDLRKASCHGIPAAQDCKISNVRSELQNILNICGNAVIRKLSDTVEKIRAVAIQCLNLLCLNCNEVGRHLPYLMPAIAARYPQMYFDSELQLFYHDVNRHERYRSGGVFEREDREAIRSRFLHHQIIESSEENRLLLCKLIKSIVQGSLVQGTINSLDPYLSEIIMMLQSNLRDQCPEVKLEGSRILVQILRIPQWESGNMYFATGLAREVISSLRHRNSKVRLVSLDLFEASVSVPNRKKLKGAGTEAIVDLVGFQEDNVLPVAAFYDAACGLTVNTLSELVSDRNYAVRARCCAMLSFFMVCLPDRCDHQQRLLPYLISFFHDDAENIRSMAIDAVNSCGQQFEAENADDVIERRQYGVDGDTRCNHDALLPPPFKKRPRLGARLFVRANTKRFFQAILMELTNWMSATRKRSAELLVTLVIYCEEYLTLDFHDTLPCIVQAIVTAKTDVDKRDALESTRLLLHVLELMGRYVPLETYVSLCLPRFSNDEDAPTSFADGGMHSEISRVAYITALTALLQGSSAKLIFPHVNAICTGLSSENYFGPYAGTETKKECLLCLVTMMERMSEASTRDIKTFLQKSDRMLDVRNVMSTCVGLFSKCAGAEYFLLTQRGRKAVGSIGSAITDVT